MGKIILSAGRTAQTQTSLGDDLKKEDCIFLSYSLSKVLVCFICHHLMKHQNFNSGIKIHLQGCDHLSYLC